MSTTRRQNSVLQERVVVSCDHVSVSADTAVKFLKALQSIAIEKVQYVNPTGLAADATNYFIVSLKKGSTIVASWSTLTGAQGAITANTFLDLVLSSTAADLVGAAGDIYSLDLDVHGTQTLPIGKLVVHGRYL